MSNAYGRSASEPRERRSHPRDNRERGTSFWNPSAPRNLDADTWRRDPSEVSAPQPPPPGRGRDDRDRPRMRAERPSSRDGRGSGGEYRHPRDYSNGARYPSSFRGRGRGRGGPRNEPIMDTKGYGRPYQRFGHPGAGPVMPSGQGTQYFSPLNSVLTDQSRFNAMEALNLFAQRWRAVSNELNSMSIPKEQKPVLYKAENTQNGVWGQPKWHVQASVSDFLTELKLAVERNQKKPTPESSQQDTNQSQTEASPSSEEN